jgi:tetratricopeptide (TPR) repeat protein
MVEHEEKRVTVKVAYNYFQSGHWDRALEEYKKLLEIDPMDFLIHNMLAEIYSRKGSKSEAVREYLNAAGLQRATNNLDKALLTYNRILRLEPENVDVPAKIAEIVQTRLQEIGEIMNRGSLAAALELCERLADRLPENTQVLEKLAEIQHRLQAPPAPSVPVPDPVAPAPSAFAPISRASAPAAKEISPPLPDHMPVIKREEVVKNLYSMAAY